MSGHSARTWKLLLGAHAWAAACIWFPTLACSQALPPLAPSPSQEQVPVEVYKAPQLKKLDMPTYIGSAMQQPEGWVELGFMVDPGGKPFEVTVIRSTGDKHLEQMAVKSLERSTFEPGSLNGTPVEADLELKYLFMDPSQQNAPGAGAEFVGTYYAAEKAIDAGDRAAADAMMKKLRVTNLYEDAYFGILSYSYAARWGDDVQQLEGLRRALAYQDRPYLHFGTLNSARLACIRLELKTHEYAEATATWKRLVKSRADERELAPLRPTMALLEKLHDDDHAYGVAGSLGDHGWYLRLFKRHFRIEIGEGVITQVKLRCAKHYEFFVFDPKLQYEVSSKDGDCSIELLGSPGTRFNLIQF